jgi:RNA polymerase sigma-70 factor (ECF subfamily)
MSEPREDVDRELVERARRAPDGDLRAFDEIVERYQNRVLANCRYLSRSPADAEDLAQEVFVKVYFGLSRFEGRSTFRTWVQRIKVNHSLNYLKKKEGKVFVDVEDPAVEAAEELHVTPRAERRLRSADERERIGAVLDRMVDTLRIPLIMRDMDQLSYREIADVLGIGLSAVKMRIKRGREEFRRLYDALGEPGPTTEEAP